MCLPLHIFVGTAIQLSCCEKGHVFSEAIFEVYQRARPKKSATVCFSLAHASGCDGHDATRRWEIATLLFSYVSSNTPVVPQSPGDNTPASARIARTQSWKRPRGSDAGSVADVVNSVDEYTIFRVTKGVRVTKESQKSHKRCQEPNGTGTFLSRYVTE